MSEFLGIIPARYASTRFPGKPLAMLGNKPMIRWVYERASTLLDHLIVATDDERILNAVRNFGGNALMTSSEHSSGTERCAEAYELYTNQLGQSFSHVLNIQGDEPLIQTEHLNMIIDSFQNPHTGIATLIRPMHHIEELSNSNVVKVVVDKSFRALYFSRAPIPYVRDLEPDQWIKKHSFYTHLGLYGFKSEVLQEIVKLPPSALEQTESLEQLRWLESGITIQTTLTHLPSQGVDTPEDLDKISKEGNFSPS